MRMNKRETIDIKEITKRLESTSCTEIKVYKYTVKYKFRHHINLLK